jgi:hypothetical protein
MVCFFACKANFAEKAAGCWKVLANIARKVSYSYNLYVSRTVMKWKNKKTETEAAP